MTRYVLVLERGLSEGAGLVVDGRAYAERQGFFLGPTVLDGISPDMALAREEIFGPVLCISRAANIDDAIDQVNAGKLGNMAVVFTSSGGTARTFRERAEVGMVGVNVGGWPSPSPSIPSPAGRARSSVTCTSKAATASTSTPGRRWSSRSGEEEITVTGLHEDVVEESLKPEWVQRAKLSYHTVELFGSTGNITEADIAPIMKGAIDIHVHGYPEALVDTGWDFGEIARACYDAGMRAICCKSHHLDTAPMAYFVQQILDRYGKDRGRTEQFRVFGGVVLDYAVGGLNPVAVKTSLKLGGKCVWLPSHDAAHHRQVLGEPGGSRSLPRTEVCGPRSTRSSTWWPSMAPSWTRVTSAPASVSSSSRKRARRVSSAS